MIIIRNGEIFVEFHFHPVHKGTMNLISLPLNTFLKMAYEARNLEMLRVKLIEAAHESGDIHRDGPKARAAVAD